MRSNSYIYDERGYLELKPYNTLAGCIKCGHDMTLDHYRASGDHGPSDSPGYGFPEVMSRDRIDRECIRCGYQWAEKPLDQA